MKDFTAVVKPELSGGDGEVKEIRISHFPCHSAPAPIPSPKKCHLLQLFLHSFKFHDLRLNNLKDLTKEKKKHL